MGIGGWEKRRRASEGKRKKRKSRKEDGIRARLRLICRLFMRLGVDDYTEVGDFHPSALPYTFYPLCRAAVLKCKCAVASYYAERPMRSLHPRADAMPSCARLLLLLLRPRKHSIMGKPCTSPSAPVHPRQVRGKDERERERGTPTDPISLGSKLGHPIYRDLPLSLSLSFIFVDNLEEELQASNFYIPRNKPLAFFFTLSSSLLLTVRFRLRYLVTTVYKKSLSLSFSVSTVANWWKGERDSDVFFTRYVPPRWKIFVAFARLHGEGVEGERSYGRKGTFSSPPPPSSPRRNPCSPSPLSSCSRCYHCRLFCGFRIICAFPRLYPPKYNKIPLARLSSSLLLLPLGYHPSVHSCCNHPLLATRGAFLVCAKGVG